MKQVEYRQNSDEWLKWRMDGIGASDAPVIMSLSPWKDYDTLLYEKVTRAKPPAPHFGMLRGAKLEPVARDIYQRRTYLHFPPVCAEMDDYPFLRASVDGYHAESQTVLEIKCPNQMDHALARTQRVPEKYYAQLQHQLLVTGARWLHYVSYDGREDCVPVLMGPDPEFQKRLLEKLIEFWNKVLIMREKMGVSHA